LRFAPCTEIDGDIAVVIVIPGATTAVVNMSTRIRVAWADLCRRLPPGQPLMEGLRELQRWLTTAAREVAAPATAALDTTPIVAAFLSAAPATLPVRRQVWERLVSAAALPGLPRNPVLFVEMVAEHLHALVVYADPDSGCRRCQGDLAVWCDPARGDRVDVCDLVGCTWTGGDRRWDGDARTLVPATRAQITAWLGGADLVPLP
jgi:hypothetical protein